MNHGCACVWSFKKWGSHLYGLWNPPGPFRQGRSRDSENRPSPIQYHSGVCLGPVLCETLVQTQTLSFYAYWLSVSECVASGEKSPSSQFPLRRNHNTSWPGHEDRDIWSRGGKESRQAKWLQTKVKHWLSFGLIWCQSCEWHQHLSWLLMNRFDVNSVLTYWTRGFLRCLC